MIVARRHDEADLVGGFIEGTPLPDRTAFSRVDPGWDELARDGMWSWRSGDACELGSLFTADHGGQVFALGRAGQPQGCLIVLAERVPLPDSSVRLVGQLSDVCRAFVERGQFAARLSGQRELDALRTFASEQFLPVREFDDVLQVLHDVLERVAVTFDCDEVIWGNRTDPAEAYLSRRFRRSDGVCDQLPPERLRVVAHPLDPTKDIIRTRFDDEALARLGIDPAEYPESAATIVTVSTGVEYNAGLGLVDYRPRPVRSQAELEVLIDLNRFIRQYQARLEHERDERRHHRYDELRLAIAGDFIDTAGPPVDDLIDGTIGRLGEAFDADLVLFQDGGPGSDHRHVWATACGRAITEHLESSSGDRGSLPDWLELAHPARHSIISGADLPPSVRRVMTDLGVDQLELLAAAVGDTARRATITVAHCGRRKWGQAEHATLVSLGNQLQASTDAARVRTANRNHRRMDELLARSAATLIQIPDFDEALDAVLSDVRTTLSARAAQWLEFDAERRTIEVRNAARPDADPVVVPTVEASREDWAVLWESTLTVRFCDDDGPVLAVLRRLFPAVTWLPRIMAPVLSPTGRPLVTLDVVLDEAPESDAVLNTISAIGHLIHEVGDRQRSNLLHATTFESVPTGQLLLDHGGVVQSANSAIRRRLGDVVGSRWIDFDPGFVPGGEEREVPLHVGRHTLWTRIRSAVIDHGQPRPTTVVHVEDVTNERSARSMLEYEASHDQLTGLGNRRRLDEEISHTSQQTDATIIMVDLDRFKVINDSLGHRAGDEVLAVVADRLRLTCRSDDLVCRFGGDEFAILLAGRRERHELAALAERLLHVVSEPIDAQGVPARMTCSLGIASAERGVGSETLLRQSDAALHDAKAEGRDRYSFFDPTSIDSLRERLTIETGLRAGLDNDEFIPYFQPEYDLLTGEILSFEALIRWAQPDGTIVPAFQFIDVAEELGLAPRMSQVALEKGCAQLRAWMADGIDTKLRVNITAAQLRNESLDFEIMSVLGQHGLGTENLCLEVTERSLLLDIESTISTLARIRGEGIEVAIDDFGTGFSSLSWLKRLPVDTLKIDRAFVQNLARDDVDREIVKTIIGLAKALGIGVVAEGVEEPAQVETLLELGCSRAMG